MAKRYSVNRPHCEYCGKRYGVARYKLHTVDMEPGTKPPAIAPSRYVLIRYQTYRHGDKTRHQYYLWDGKSLDSTQHQPFCSLKCALAFARHAHEAGHRHKLFSLEDV